MKPGVYEYLGSITLLCQLLCILHITVSILMLLCTSAHAFHQQ